MSNPWKILVADDDPAILKLLDRVFEDEGYKVFVASTGDGALDLWARTGYPSIIMLDWSLPGLSGIELCKAIRAHSQGKFAFIMFLTSRGLRDNIIAGMNAGADDYIVKPFNVEELKARVRAGVRLLDLQRQLLSRNAMLEELVNSVTHDMRTPLIAMDMTAEQALDGVYGELPESYAKILKTTRRSTQGLLDLVETLLRVAKFESGAPAEKVEQNSDVVDVGQQCITELEPLYKKKMIQLDLEANEREVWVKVDRRDLKRIMQNLLDNAIKFTPKEGHIKLSIERAAGKVIVGVQDTGMGLKKVEALQVFERFARAEHSMQIPGTGLGLYLCRRIIESHGGAVECIPRPGGGTTFGFLLPVES